jgi:hypothetical protein
MKCILTLTLLILTLGLISTRLLGQAGNERSESKHARFPASRTTMQGEVWLSWEIPVREWFVESALAGYKAGYDEGCKDAMKAHNGLQAGNQQKLGEDICPNSRRFRNDALPYSRQMTEFYTAYPEDRDLPLAYLIQMLVGPKPKTLDEIHRWVSSIDK